jgi:glycosyltransferase involved in cell wall biosynthesis
MQSHKNHKKIIFLTPYPYEGAPGQRFRYEQYLNILREHNFDYELLSFLNIKTNSILYKKGRFVQKIIGVLRGFLFRFTHLIKIIPADFVFIFREATPLGPPVLEWVIAKVLRKRIIYDFDDAIWIPNTSEVNKAAAFLKCTWKVRFICRWAWKVSAGNAWLAAYARQYHPRVVVNPTTIDTEALHNPRLFSKPKSPLPVIGWTGTHSTLHYLRPLAAPLQRLHARYPFELLVIANQPPDFDLPGLKFLPWHKETEIADLLRMDIGLMPLTPDAWSEGKCGFKALQYLALEIPAVASPVGVNSQMVVEGKTGFLCETEEDWYHALEVLLLDAELRARMGKAGRAHVEAHYSVNSNREVFGGLFYER